MNAATKVVEHDNTVVSKYIKKLGKEKKLKKKFQKRAN